MAIKKGLGKGLGALIPEGPEAPVQTKVIEKKVVIKEPSEVKLKINEVEPNREQPRQKFDEDALIELAESIKQYGILQPLLVQKRDKYYEIIAGERRWRAAKIAGLKEVPVVIKDYTEQELVEVALIENIQREDLNAIEEAQAYQKLINDYKLKQDELAERVSKSRSAITNSMRLLKLNPQVQKMLIDDMISSGHARTLLAIDDQELQYTVALKVFDEKMSVRDLEKYIKNMNKPEKNKQAPATPNNDFIYRDIEDKLKTVVGTKVVIHNKDNNKGKIEIDYYSKEEFERIIEILNK